MVVGVERALFRRLQFPGLRLPLTILDLAQLSFLFDFRPQRLLGDDIETGLNVFFGIPSNNRDLALRCLLSRDGAHLR
jgi:hypothetical protein